MLLLYQSSIVSQILDIIHWTVKIFSFDHMIDENREYPEKGTPFLGGDIPSRSLYEALALRDVNLGNSSV